MTTAIGYLRISSDPQDQRLGVTRQRADVERLAATLGADLVAIFEDNDLSASKVRGANSEWARALAHVEEQRPTYLLAYRMDRLGRRMADLEALDDLARATGLKVHTTAEGDIFANSAWPVLVATAKMEARSMAARVSRSQESRRAQGKDSAGGRRPYGYAADRLTIIEHEAAVLREVAGRVIANESVTEICRDLESRAIRRVGGEPWQIDTLRRTLMRSRYAGFQVYKGEIIGKGAWPPILDEGTHDALQARLNATRLANPRGGRPVSSLLGGLVKCGLCHHKMSAGMGNRNLPVYRCLTLHGGCGKVTRARAGIEAFVVERALASYDTDTLGVERNAVEGQLAGIRDAIGDIEHRIWLLRTQFESGRLAGVDYFPSLEVLRNKATDLVKTRSVLQAQVRTLAPVEGAAERWESWTLDQRRAFLRSRLVAVLICPAGRKGRHPITDADVELVGV
jgi:site-specific DNA recombinase